MSQPEIAQTAEADYDDAAIERAVARAVRHALLHHKRVGNPIAALRDGKVVWIPPEAIDGETAPCEDRVP